MKLTLWDFIEPIAKRLQLLAPAAPAQPRSRTRPRPPHPQRRRPPSPPAPGSNGTARPRRTRNTRTSNQPAQDRYDEIVRQMLAEYQIRVRKWRSGMSGIAWYVTYTDGRRQNLIEAPRPKGPMSAAIFLHEIGHHAIGFDVYKPRCLEEYHAWRWAIEAMERHGLNITDAVRYRMHGSLHYAVQKAVRRGIRVIPPELTPFLERAVKPKPTRRRARR